jgi:Family of unknown function (DUF6188)
VVEGCVIRELPDGGSEFVLDEPTLSFIRVDRQSRLQFGRTDVVVGGPFLLRLDGIDHRLDPRHTDTLGPLLVLYPGTVRWLWATPDGDLLAVFENGSRLSVPTDRTGTSWSVGNVYYSVADSLR